MAEGKKEKEGIFGYGKKNLDYTGGFYYNLVVTDL